MPLALLTMITAQLFDLGTFVRMVEWHGSAAEANPLVHGLLIGFGLPFVAVVKVAALSLVVAIVAVLAGRAAAGAGRPAGAARLIGVVVAVAIVAGLLGGFSNARVIL
jgi:hypothetical protein